MISCYIDAAGFPRVDVRDMPPLIGAYLEQDVQSDSASGREIIQALDDVIAGRRADWAGTGNAHTITIRPDCVVIHNDWDETADDATLPPLAFRQCIVAWLDFVCRLV